MTILNRLICQDNAITRHLLMLYSLDDLSNMISRHPFMSTNLELETYRASDEIALDEIALELSTAEPKRLELSTVEANRSKYLWSNKEFNRRLKSEQTRVCSLLETGN